MIDGIAGSLPGVCASNSMFVCPTLDLTLIISPAFKLTIALSKITSSSFVLSVN